jgi:hypothetical protein
MDRWPYCGADDHRVVAAGVLGGANLIVQDAYRLVGGVA